MGYGSNFRLHKSMRKPDGMAGWSAGDTAFSNWEQLELERAIRQRADAPIEIPLKKQAEIETKRLTEEGFIEACTAYASQKEVTEYGITRRPSDTWETRLLTCIKAALNNDEIKQLMADHEIFAQQFPRVLRKLAVEFALERNDNTLPYSNGSRAYDFMFTDLDAKTESVRPDVKRVIEKFALQCLVNFWSDQELVFAYHPDMRRVAITK